eukprot:m.43363 g.43363  ORF g.43363 m.43363 type:complete len:490 (+) comp9972_c0_seq1:40-1509(+)
MEESAMMLLLTVASSFALINGQKPSVPTDNPVATRYGNGTYAWADNMVNWTNVVNVEDYQQNFEKAQTAVLQMGGSGVVYFPAGTYKFSNNITIASNVVIRGVPTTDDAKNGKNEGNLAPKTVFQCPDKAHLGIFNVDPKGKNMGVVNIDLDGCAVMFWPTLGPNPVSFKSYWYGATKVIGLGTNKLVLGNRVRNVNLGNPSPSIEMFGSNTSTTSSAVWPWSFSTAIAVYSDNNTLVANNLLAKATSTGTMKAFDGKTVPYPYDNRYGIDVNKVLLGGAFGKYVPGASPGVCEDATQFEWSFRRNLVIRDNYVYGNGRVGISYSGGGDGKTKGSGTQVINNHIEHNPNGVFYGFAPDKPPHGSDTNENRGFDQDGIENNVTGNTGHIYRQLVYGTKFETVDGEGILVQCSNGNNQYRNIWNGNDLTGGGSGYIAYYGVNKVEDCDIIGNTVNSDQQIGFLNMHPQDVVKDITCKGNKPKCSMPKDNNN